MTGAGDATAAPLSDEPAPLLGAWRGVLDLIALAFALFHLYTATIGILEGMQQRVIHLGFALVLIFLGRPLGARRTPHLLDIALCILSLVPSVYLVFEDAVLDMRMGIAYQRDIVLGAILVVVLLEATRRVAGFALPLLAALSIAYAFAGQWLPNAIAHAGFTFEDVTVTLYLTTEGIFSVPLAISATYIVLFIVLGAVLQATGAAQFFSDLAYALFGQVRGGPAKVAVVASGLFGMISGSAVANVASTGVLTIPLMKRLGFSARFAGAVEAVASSCGQFMPPVMASAAFVIAETLSIPYLRVAAGALIPALLYYAALFVSVDLRAARMGLRGQPRSELPPLGPVLRQGAYLMLVPTMLVVMLAVFGYSPLKAAIWTIGMNALLYVMREFVVGRAEPGALPAAILLVLLHLAVYALGQVAGARPAGLAYITILVAAVVLGRGGAWPALSFLRARILVLAEALRAGARGSLEVAVACASSGIIIGMLMLTGLGLRLSGLLVDLAAGSLPLLLVLTMIASLILGMGVPTLGAYIVLAILVAPGLVQLGVEPLAAHLFIFYFGVISAITPPVCMAAFAAAAISGAHPMRTGLTAVRLGVPVFIVPFIMVYHPAMILEGSAWQIMQVSVTGLVGASALAAALEGYLLRELSPLMRALCAVGGLCLIFGDLATDIAGIVILGSLLGLELVARKAAPAGPAIATKRSDAAE
ncbi:MAG: TRAP transporter fused permease subunit [Alphaproteobacteria bacterium]|nr:TRAP transporter fused permease subunit [Alphaproteobacteria bacterium]